MQADHHSQEPLEAVAEALEFIHGYCMVGSSHRDKVIADKAEAGIAALAASRQPVSGGLEGDVEAALLWLRTKAFTAAPDIRIHAVALLAALSRVPADGQQPAGRWTIYVCPGCGNWAAPADLEPRFGNIVVHDKPTGDCSADPLKVEVVPASPADGPVSASRPPEAGSDDDARIAAFQAFRDAKDRGNSEDVGLQDAMNAYVAGLGDRQLTAEEIEASVVKDLLRVVEQQAINIQELMDRNGELVAKSHRLASGENPDG